MLLERAPSGLGALTCAALLAVLSGCGTPPPASKVPTARAAVDRIHATQDCGVGIHATAKIDHFGKGGRIRGDLLAFAVWPDKATRDKAWELAMQDPRLKMEPKDMPYDGMRMFWGGFKPIIEL